MQHRDFERAGVAVVASYLVPRWRDEVEVILRTLSAYHPEAERYGQIAGLMSRETAGQLRDDLRSVAPSLASFVDYVMASLAASGCGVYVHELGLAGFDNERRARLLYALSACIDEPSPTNAQGGQVVWDVALRRTDAGYFATFSEHDGEAAFHTDTQYYPIPDRWFALYVMAPAQCGGGLSVMCDGEAVRTDLGRASTRWALQLLEERKLPFRVPSAFATDPRPGLVQATLAPVFSTLPGVRYRRDTLINGWLHFPEYRDDDIERAVLTLEEELAHTTHAVRFGMPRDSLLLADNHRALHARTAFADPHRHLLRIRMRGNEGSERALFELVSRETHELHAVSD